MKNTLRTAALLPLLLVATPMWAQTPAMSPELPVNVYTTGAQREVGVAADQAGNFALVWSSFGQDGAGTGIFGRQYDPSGNPLGVEFQINSYTTANQFRPAITMNGAGNFVVVWTSGGQDGQVAGVFGQRFDADGDPAGAEFQANTYTSNYQQQPDVAMNASGDFVVVWNSFAGQDGSSAGIFGQRYTSAGSAQGSEFQVNTHTTSYQNFPAVAMDSTGDFVVVWQSGFQDGSLTGIFGRRYASAGNPLGGEFQVNTHTSNYQLFPDVAMHPSGSFVVAWESQGAQDGAYIGSFARRYDSSGAPLDAVEFQVNTYTTSSQRHPRVAVAPSGDFVVAWHSFGQDDPNPGLPVTETGVFAQRFDQTGRRLGAELAINTYTTDLQETPAVAMDGRGGFVIGWESYAQDGASLGAYARRGGFPPAAPMEVDQRASGGSSNLNGVLESGERVAVDPAWTNSSDASLTLSGTASNLTGPPGPAYALNDGTADYGSIAAAATNNCLDATANCFEVTVGGARPAPHWDATFDEALTPAGPDQAVEPPRRRELPRRAPERLLSVHREPVSQRDHGGLRRGRILPRQQRHARADGGLPPEIPLRIELRAPGGDRDRVPRRSCLEPVRSLDREPREPRDHRRMRRRTLLPEQSRHPPANGGLSLEDKVRCFSCATPGDGPVRRRLALPRHAVRLHRGALQRRHHRRMPDESPAVLSGQRRPAAADGGLPRQDVRLAALRSVTRPKICLTRPSRVK